MVVLISASGKPLRLSTALREALQDKPRLAVRARALSPTQAAIALGVASSRR